MVVAGPAHGDVYRDGWRREEVLAEPQGRFGELVETWGLGAQQWRQRMMLFDTERQGARVGPWSECRSYSPTPAASPRAGQHSQHNS